jgi:transposase-like protein
MNWVDAMNETKRKTRRRYGAELKQQILAECAELGAPVAGVAFWHGINANVVHKWRRQDGSPLTALQAPAFVPVALLPEPWLGALEQVLHARQLERDGSLVCHLDRGAQYVSIRYSERLAQAGGEPSVGSKGDSYDDAVGQDDQRVVQGRGDSPTVIANPRIGGAGHPGMGLLGQPSLAARTHWIRPAGRS